MKRSIIAFGLALGLLLTPHAFAASEVERGAAAGITATFQEKVNAQTELNKAIRIRQIRYLLELKRGHEDRGTKLAQHNYNLYRNNVDTTSTSLSRSGTLTDYTGRRHNSSQSLAAPNNPKRNFRVRAIDYYVDGGDAGKKVLEENVILGSKHSVSRNYYSKQLRGQAGYADLIQSLRALAKIKLR